MCYFKGHLTAWFSQQPVSYKALPMANAVFYVVSAFWEWKRYKEIKQMNRKSL